MRVFGLGQASFDFIALVDGFPAEDLKKEVLEFTEQGGGPVATALVSLSRLGVETAFGGVVYDDDAGGKIRQGLIDEGVDIEALAVREGGVSQLAFIIVNSVSASRTILWKRPTGAELGAAEVKREWLRGTDCLLLDGLMEEASIRIADVAVEAGLPVVLDAGSPREGLLRLLPKADYIVGSEVFSNYFHADPEEAVKKIAESGAKAVTVTLGDRGSVTWVGEDGGRVFTTPAFMVKAVDTTGAGDVFHGGYIFGLLQKWPMEEVVRFASAFAALKCIALGGRAGIPALSTVKDFMESAKTI